MILRTLEPWEWGRVAGTDLAQLLPQLDPKRVDVLAVEDGDTLAGCWALVWMPHAEGVWIHPAYRGQTSVARKLWTGMQQLAASFGLRSLVTGACDPLIAALLEKHHATKVQQDTYVLPLKGRR